MRNFTAQERETTINFNDAEDVAHIYTRQRVVWEDLKRRGFKPSKIDKNGRIYAMTFDVPKNLVLIRKPRILSAKEKSRLVEVGRRLAEVKATMRQKAK